MLSIGGSEVTGATEVLGSLTVVVSVTTVIGIDADAPVVAALLAIVSLDA